MGIFDLFRKDEVFGAKVLVCAIGNAFDDRLQEDSQVYAQFYRSTTTAVVPTIQALFARLDWVRLFKTAAFACPSQEAQERFVVVCFEVRCDVRFMIDGLIATDQSSAGIAPNFRDGASTVHMQN